MDAVNQYKVYFGGSYQEQWSDDYCMTVAYSDRKLVNALYYKGTWVPVSGDRQLMDELNQAQPEDLIQLYFQAASGSYAAVHQCFLLELELDRLDECLRDGDNPLVAPELMRILMDDCGLTMEKAYDIVAACCHDLRSENIDVEQMLTYQPRTAHVIGLLRRCAETMLAVECNSLSLRCRSPFGAVRTGEELTLGFDVLGGHVDEATLELWGDNFEQECPLMSTGKHWGLTLLSPECPQALWYAFKIKSDEKELYIVPNHDGYKGKVSEKKDEGFRLTVYASTFDTPEWFRKCIIYQIFPDRFACSCNGTAEKGIEYHKSLGQTPELHKSIFEEVRWQPRDFEENYSPDDFYGGNFKGIEQKLEYLKLLGISVIYLNPIVEARSNHRYDTSDYHRPDPILGTMEDFESLCKSAEKMGIRLILDGVYSHTGADSRYFNKYGNYPSKGACQGQDSRFYPWYDFQEYPDKYRCWWGFADLPEVDECNPEWQKDIINGENSVVKLWLRHGASGWRLDVADELPDAVLELIRSSAKAEKPDAPIVGEVWEDAVIKESYGARRRYALGTALDSVMNYPFRSAVLNFIHGKSDAYQLRDFLISQQINYPQPMYYSLMNLLGSHDVERLRTALATDINLRDLSREDQLNVEFSQENLDKAIAFERICAALQFSIPGVPSIYYGDEQGMCGVNDPFNRRPFIEGDSALHDFYASLCKTRNSAAALSTGHAKFMAAGKDVLLVLRYIVDGKDALGKPADNSVYLSIINRSDKPQHYLVTELDNYSGTIGPISAEIIKIR
jgi:4-alpha-glucanotransferase